MTILLRGRYNRHMQYISTYIQDILRQRGSSLRRLASDTGISPSTLSRWLSGGQKPSPQSCHKLAESLSVPVEHVLAWAGHLEPMQRADMNALPEFREYAQQKYPTELDEDVVAMIEDLIQRRRSRLNESR